MNSSDDYTPEEAQRELLDITIRCARRCAYDLAHCSHMIERDRETRNLFEQRAKHWLSIFDPTNGPKDYRLRLHHQMDQRDAHIAELQQKLIEAGVKFTSWEDTF